MNEPTISYIDVDTDSDEACSALARAIAPLVLDELISGKPTEDTPHGRALTAAVYRAVDTLEGQGSRSERIALQLLQALAHYEFALGQLFVPESVEFFQVQWCRWEHGGDADMQEWHPSDTTFEDETLARERCIVLDNQFAPHFRHRTVKVGG